MSRAPIYSVEVYSDGTVVFLGGENVAAPGIRESAVDPSIYESLVKLFDDSGFWSMQNFYAIPIKDLESCSLTVNQGGREHTILNYGNGSRQLLETAFPEMKEEKVDWASCGRLQSLADEVDASLKTDRWTKTSRSGNQDAPR